NTTENHTPNELHILTYEYSILYDRLVFADAFVVAGNRAGADVHVGAYFSISDVREMRRLRPLAEDRFLGLDEISNSHMLAKLRSRPEVGVRPDRRLILDDRILGDASALEVDVVADSEVVQVDG